MKRLQTIMQKEEKQQEIGKQESEDLQPIQTSSEGLNDQTPHLTPELIKKLQELELHQYSDGRIIVFYKPKMTQEEFKIVSTLNTIFKKSHKLNIHFKLTEDKQLQLWQQ